MSNEQEFMNGELQAKVEYAFVHNAFQYGNGTPTFKVTALLETDEQVKAAEGLLEAHGVSLQVRNPNTDEMINRIRPNKQGIMCLTFTRKATNSQGHEANITVVDADTNIIPKSILIGNGSTAIISFFSYQPPGKKSRALRLSGLQVLDLVPVEKTTNTGGFKKQDGGFSVADLNAINEEGTNAVYSSGS
jgi:hypothetical protein